MVQRYKFESKSQPSTSPRQYSPGCFQWFKDTNLKVNHNTDVKRVSVGRLFPMVQRYKFESKSQRPSHDEPVTLRCFQWFKDTNLKVNHNFGGEVVYGIIVVSNGSKIQI